MLLSTGQSDVSYHAVSCLGDAVDATKAFLLPVERERWLKLAVVVFFLSGGTGVGSAPSASGQVSAGAGVGDVAGEPFGDLPVPGEPAFDRLLPVLVGLVAVIALVALVFVLVGSVMEFVLVEALRTESVAVRAPARRHLRDGLALFVFRLVLGVIVFGLLGTLGFVLVLPAVDAGGAQLAVGILVVVLVGIVVGAVAALVHELTVQFVVPVMVQEGRGLVDGWRRFWPVLRGNLGQFAVYVLVRIAVAILVGIVASIVVGVLAVVLAIPFVLVGVALFLGFGGTLTLTTGIGLGVVAVGYFLLLLAVSTVVHVPLKTFTRYYELLVLGDVESDLDLVAERRASVRAHEE